MKKTKDIDQLCSYCTTDQRLCFLSIDRVTPLLSKINFNLLTILCSCLAWFESGHVKDPDGCFFIHTNAHSLLTDNSLLIAMLTKLVIILHFVLLKWV